MGAWSDTGKRIETTTIFPPSTKLKFRDKRREETSSLRLRLCVKPDVSFFYLQHGMRLNLPYVMDDNP